MRQGNNTNDTDALSNIGNWINKEKILGKWERHIVSPNEQ